MIAPDGFDFSKPYIPKITGATEVAPSETPPGSSTLAPSPLKKPMRPVAALLGGLGRKTR
jgi:ATP-dependent RNA helicase RhlE